MGHAKYVGRVGALAVALGVGIAVATTPGVAWADDTGASSSDTPPDNSATDAGAGAPGTMQTPSSGGSDDTGDRDTASRPTTTTTTEGSSTTTVIGGGSAPKVTYGNSGGYDSVDAPTAVKDPVESVAPSTAPSTRPLVETPAEPVAVPTVAPANPTSAPAVEQITVVEEPTPHGSSDKAADVANPLSLSDSSPSTNPRPESATFAAPSIAARLPRAQVADAPVVSNLLQTSAFSALDVPEPAPPSVAPTTLLETLVAIPGTIISTALNLITQALAPLIGPGAPVDNPILWAVLAFVRRQFNQGFANSTPALAPQQTSQDLDDNQVHGTFGGTDADGDALIYTVPAAGVGAPAHGTVTINQAAGTYTYTPAGGFVGEDSFNVTATDDTGGTHIHALGQTHIAVAKVFVSVADTNDSPVAVNDSFTSLEDTPLTSGNVLANDSDPDGNTLTASIVTGPSHAASFTLNSDGTFSYTPISNYYGPDSFTYTAGDGALTSNTAAATIAVDAVDDAPVISNQIRNAPDASGSFTGSFRVTDVDSADITITAADPAYGELSYTVNTVDANTRDVTYTYTLSQAARLRAGFTPETETDAFTFTVAGAAQSSTVGDINVKPLVGTATLAVVPGIDYYGLYSATSVNNRLYVKVDGYKVAIIDADTLELEGTAVLNSFSSGLAVTPDGRKAIGQSSSGAGVNIVDLTVADPQIQFVATGGGPQWVTLNADGSRAYVSNLDSKTVSVIDLSTSTPTKLFDIVTPDRPEEAVVVGDRIYVTNFDGSLISVHDVNTGAELDRIPLGTSSPWDVDIVPGKGVLAVKTQSDGLEFIDVDTGDLLQTLRIAGSSLAVSFSPDGSVVYTTQSVYDPQTAQYSAYLVMVDTGTFEVIGTVPLPAEGSQYHWGIATATNGSVFLPYDEDLTVITFSDPTIGLEV